jgi:hypothetical protein
MSSDKILIRLSSILFISCWISAGSISGQQVSIFSDHENPEIRFAIDEIVSACSETGINAIMAGNSDATIVIEIRPDDKELKKEGFSIRNMGKTIMVTGADAAGAMYGSLELSEQIRLYGVKNIRETIQNPYMETRGTKFNIPLDARTPSYSDASDAAQKNIPEVWSFNFWQEYIDNLARYRYNLISLWNLHPFPSMVKVPGYPEVALNDVHRSTADWKEHYHLHGTGLDTPEILDNPEIVMYISMEEKIEFWNRVMRYARDRNIHFIVVTWNIFINGTEGKYGITEDINNEITQDYFRKSIEQMFLTYPDLAGIGLTTGENMPGAGFAEKEDWVYKTYAQGLMDAAAEMPDRHFRFIHRQHQAGAGDIIRKFRPLIDRENIEFLFSFKYAEAHVFSSTKQSFHERFVKDIEGMKTLWTLRNDDNYHFRWGSPDFVREFILNIPHEVSAGFYYGSDQWIWGREFLAKKADTPRQIEIVKHWYHWMLWGRLGYDPNITNERFTGILQSRFPEINGRDMFAAWHNSSMVYPVTTGFHWGALDFQWYIEACKSRPEFARNETGFHDVNRFISLPPHPESGYQSINDFVKMTVSSGKSELLSPFEVSGRLHSHADEALRILEGLNPGNNDELLATLNDIRTVAYLGKYYAFKIAGATYLQLFRETRNSGYQGDAVDHLEQALGFWKKYTGAASEQYSNPLWTNRVGYINWSIITGWVEHDIEIAREDPDI